MADTTKMRYIFRRRHHFATSHSLLAMHELWKARIMMDSHSEHIPPPSHSPCAAHPQKPPHHSRARAAKCQHTTQSQFGIGGEVMGKRMRCNYNFARTTLSASPYSVPVFSTQTTKKKKTIQKPYA